MSSLETIMSATYPKTKSAWYGYKELLFTLLYIFGFVVCHGCLIWLLDEFKLYMMRSL